jgi:hypothetical protein
MVRVEFVCQCAQGSWYSLKAMMGATLSLVGAILLKGATAVALVWVMRPVQGLRVSVLIAMSKGASVDGVC